MANSWIERMTSALKFRPGVRENPLARKTETTAEPSAEERRRATDFCTRFLSIKKKLIALGCTTGTSGERVGNTDILMVTLDLTFPKGNETAVKSLLTSVGIALPDQSVWVEAQYLVDGMSVARGMMTAEMLQRRAEEGNLVIFQGTGLQDRHFDLLRIP